MSGNENTSSQEMTKSSDSQRSIDSINTGQQPATAPTQAVTSAGVRSPAPMPYPIPAQSVQTQQPQSGNFYYQQPMAPNGQMIGRPAGQFNGQPMGQPMVTQYGAQGQQMPLNPNQPGQQYMVYQQAVPYDTLPDGTVVLKGGFDSHSRFDGIAKPSIPPPPPGVAPNSAQLAHMMGKKVMITKKNNSGFWNTMNDPDAGESTFW